MKILVTGATGFIGSAFVRHALAQGHTIGALIRLGKTIPSNLPQHESLCVLSGTLAEPPISEIKRFRADACLHLAWIATPGVYLESPENEWFRDVSLTFVRRVIETGTWYIVGVGTCLEYQMTGEPLSETRTPIAPTTMYARCKNELRVTLEAEARAHDFTLAWGRVFYPYGFGEHPDRLCSSIIRKLMRGEQVVLKNPNSVKDYIYIYDLASAILRTIETRLTGPINWGTGMGVSVRQIADTAAELWDRSDLISNAPTDEKDSFSHVVADSSRLRSLGWQARISLKQGLDTLWRSL